MVENGIQAPRVLDIRDYSLDGLTHLHGVEKDVYKLTNTPYGIVCAKVIKEKDTVSMRKQNREVMARKELEAYLRFKKSSAGLYVPEPYGLVSAGEDIVGLAVAWKDAESLSKLYPAKPLTGEAVDRFHQALLHMTDQQIVPDTDNFSEANLLVDTFGSLWFAECKIVSVDPSSRTIKKYHASVDNNMRYLREVYVHS